MALFGQTAAEWRDSHPDERGNIRDQANIWQLVTLSNLENLNAHFIREGMPQDERLERLNRCLLYTSPSPRDRTRYRMQSSA